MISKHLECNIDYWLYRERKKITCEVSFYGGKSILNLSMANNKYLGISKTWTVHSTRLNFLPVNENVHQSTLDQQIWDGEEMVDFCFFCQREFCFYLFSSISTFLVSEIPLIGQSHL